jgi:hypothetical protein
VSIVLAMIVRDAEKTIERCIRSALPLVSSGLFIDTGCTDKTMSIVRDVFDEVALPLSTFESEWKGHAHNRTELLEKTRATDADYALMIDADMELVIEGELPELTADEYMIPIRDRGLVYPLPLITSTKKRFFYAGVAHAYLACHDGPTEGLLLGQLALIDHGGGGGRPGKIQRDAELLALEVARNPDDARSWFYLAQSFRDLDEVIPAIECYKRRASMGGFDEEVYNSLYQAGALLSEHISAMQGMPLLLEAWTMRPTRAEALRTLSAVAANVADKIPYPMTDLLFVRERDYKQPGVLPHAVDVDVEVPALPAILPKPRPKRLRRKLRLDDVTAVIVTRGNVDLSPCLDPLPYKNVVVWDNSQRNIDYRVFGRYAALAEVTTPLVYWQDDDVIPHPEIHDRLLLEYERDKVVANMDDPWIDGAGYRDKLVMMGAGSICDYDLPHKIFEWYFQHYDWDDDLLVECDFAFGTLAPSKRIDVPYTVREFSDDLDRLYQQPGQTERKWGMIWRCLQIIAADGPMGWQGSARAA